jgi:asparagine synthase (glutamine-hydrolysing)
LRSLLEETVESHLIADVPVGVFLSSGIDSTVVAALAAQKRPDIRTITVVFPEREFSEAEQARSTAQQLGTRHQELTLSADDMLARLDEAVDALDQPSMDGVNTFFVSWAARQAGLKVALSGLGGDELFGGYSTFRTTRDAKSVASMARILPETVRSAMASAAERVSKQVNGRDSHRKMIALWRDPNFLPHSYFYTRLLFTPEQVLELSPCNGVSGREPWENWLTETARGSDQLDDFTAISCLECRSYMVNTLLRDTDSMSMANSLEVRVPFLDHALVEYVTRLPGSMKCSNGTPKSLLIEATRDLLPDRVASQRKRTFTLPWEHWLRGALKKQVETEFGNIAPALRECLSMRKLGNVWTDFLQQRTSWSRVWSLFVLNRWAERHLVS